MTAEEVAVLPRGERVKMSHGLGRRAKKSSHSHGGHSSARNGWTCGDTHDKGFGKTGKPSKSPALSPYRVVMPKNRVRYVRPVEA